MTGERLLARLTRVGGDVAIITSLTLTGDVGAITMRGHSTDLRWNIEEPRYVRVESHAAGAEQVACTEVRAAIAEWMRREGRLRRVDTEVAS